MSILCYRIRRTTLVEGDGTFPDYACCHGGHTDLENSGAISNIEAHVSG